MLIYIIENLINNKKYVGQTTQSLQRRFQAHIDNAKKNHKQNKKYKSIIGNALIKYDRDNFRIRKLEDCNNQKELDEAEKKWINYYNCKFPKGYNIREGGARGKHSEETKKKLRHKIVSQETRKKISEAMKGKKLSPERKRKFCEYGDKWREYVHNHPEMYRGEKNSNAKLNKKQVGEIRELYSTNNYSQEELGKKYGVKQVTISKIIIKRNWKY